MGSKLQPAALGGLLIGVLSALPYVNKLNACCCLWVIAGGLVTTYLLQERSSTPVTAGEAAVGGLLAGVVGAVIGSIIGLALIAVTGGVQQSLDQFPRDGIPPEFERAIDQLRQFPSWLWYLLSFVIALVIYPIFSMLGALLGVAIFRRQPPPPPPGTVEILPPE